MRRLSGLVIGVAFVLTAAARAFAFDLASSAFPAGGAVPGEFTCDGVDRSPPLRWSDAPPGTRSFALVVDDPDAPGGTWVHWVLYRVPAAVGELAAAVPSRETLPGVGVQGVNDFRKIGYGGPCPPPGRAHRYVFHLYALDLDPQLPPGRTAAQVRQAIDGHVLGQAELIGRYARR